MLVPDRCQARTDQAVAPEFDPCIEDGCGPNHLLVYQHVEELKRELVEISLEGESLLSVSLQVRVISA